MKKLLYHSDKDRSLNTPSQAIIFLIIMCQRTMCERKGLSTYGQAIVYLWNTILQDTVAQLVPFAQIYSIPGTMTSPLSQAVASTKVFRLMRRLWRFKRGTRPRLLYGESEVNQTTIGQGTFRAVPRRKRCLRDGAAYGY